MLSGKTQLCLVIVLLLVITTGCKPLAKTALKAELKEQREAAQEQALEQEKNNYQNAIETNDRELCLQLSDPNLQVPCLAIVDKDETHCNVENEYARSDCLYKLAQVHPETVPLSKQVDACLYLRHIDFIDCYALIESIEDQDLLKQLSEQQLQDLCSRAEERDRCYQLLGMKFAETRSTDEAIAVCLALEGPTFLGKQESCKQGVLRSEKGNTA